MVIGHLGVPSILPPKPFHNSISRRVQKKLSEFYASENVYKVCQNYSSINIPHHGNFSIAYKRKHFLTSILKMSLEGNLFIIENNFKILITHYNRPSLWKKVCSLMFIITMTWVQKDEYLLLFSAMLQ